jgi:predicted extracellular nuclease
MICLGGVKDLTAQVNHLVISQVYGGAGCATAGCSFYQNDFIEIFNPSSTPVNLNGWSVQYASPTGATWQQTALANFSLQPGQYYLIAEAFNSNGVNALPLADVTGSINMGATGGKVALVNSTIPLSSSCPTVSEYVDLVGYGSSNNCSESGAASAPSITTSITRKNGGCKDSDVNAADFDVLTPLARNHNSTFNNCTADNISINDISLMEGNSGTKTFSFNVSLSSPAPAGGVSFDIATADNTATVANNDYVSKSLNSQIITAGISNYTFSVTVNGDLVDEANENFFVNLSNVFGATVTDAQGQGTILNDDAPGIPISTVQGSGNSSALLGQIVTVQGIVTGIRSNGFFMQTPDASVDADPATSEGIFVFTGSVPPGSVAAGNELVVTGTVVEFIPSVDPNSQPFTEISINPFISLQSTGNPLPSAIVLTNTDLLINNINNLERFEGMRVQVNSLTCTTPSSGTFDEASATATNTGYFYGVITGTPRPFREPGVQLPDPLPVGAPANVPRWDTNPEILGIDSKALTGSTALNVAGGAIITAITGPLDYVRRYYTIDLDPVATPGISNNSLVYTPVPAATAAEVSIASLNLQRFFDATDDPALIEPILSSTAFNNRLNKASLTIRNVLNDPDVIGVEEVENLSSLQAIAAKVNNDALALGQPNPNYQAYLIEGNDVTGIDVGFLVKSSKINMLSVNQYGKTDTYINPTTGSPVILFDRPPLLLMANFTKAGCVTPIPFTVIINHSASLGNIADLADGARARAKRKTQAEYLANFIQGRQVANASEKIITIGHYNAYQLNDGYVDVMGTIKGTPAPADQVVAASADLVDPDLINLTDSYSQTGRYSYNFSGSAMAFDHVLITQNISAQVSAYAVARLGADFPQSYYGDNNRPERLTDHDVPVAFFNFVCSDPSAATDYFRTRASGNWNSIATWESSADAVNWHAATLTPDATANTISILNGHAVVVTANVTVDQVIINLGCTVTVNTGVNFTVL